jgi:hypothetical protein
MVARGAVLGGEEAMRKAVWDSNEYHIYVDNIANVILNVAKQYINSDKYDIWMCEITKVWNRGWPFEFTGQYLSVHLVKKDESKSCGNGEHIGYCGNVDYHTVNLGPCGNGEHIGNLGFGESGYITGRNGGTIFIKGERRIRRIAREGFERWAKEKIENGEEEKLNPKIVKRLSAVVQEGSA